MLDLMLSWIPNVWLSVAFLVPLLYWYSTRNHNYWRNHGVASPPTYPFIGNFISLTKPLALLLKGYVETYGKVFGVYQSQKPILMIADPVILKRIMVQDFHLFRNRIKQPIRSKIMAKNLVATRNEEWKRIRSILTPMFTNSKLRKMENLMGSCVSALIEALGQVADTSGTFLAHDSMGNFTMDVIAKCAFATHTNTHKDKDNVFVRNAKKILNFNLWRTLFLLAVPSVISKVLFNLRTPYIYVSEIDFFQNISLHLIKERRSNLNKSQHDDMLQLMVKAENKENKVLDEEDLLDAHHVNTDKEELETEQKALSNIIGSKFLSEEEIIAQAIVFFLAGYETTASTLTFCLYELSINPKIQERLYQEVQKAKQEDPDLSYQTVTKLPYLDAVISETLRKYPPAFILNREASDEYHIPEYNITLYKEQGITIPVYAIHHSEEYYPNPEQFNPERFLPENRHMIVPYTYLPFGGGPRNCIGMRFALSEAKLGLAKIIDRFYIYKSAKTVDKLELKMSVVLLKTTPIYVGIKRRLEN